MSRTHDPERRPLIFLDSGLGGIPYALRFLEEAPGQQIIYVADTEFFPYGERESSQIVERVTLIVADLVSRFDPRAIVVACNTASVTALATLRQRFELPFVGVVPAIKPAARSGGAFAVLATQATVSDNYLSRLIKQFAPETVVRLVPAGGLVELVERRLGNFSRQDLNAVIVPAIEMIGELDVRSVVLGCTHFVHVRDEIRASLPAGVALVDSLEGVTRQILRVAGVATESTPQPSQILVTGRVTTPYRLLAMKHDLLLTELYARDRSHR